MQLVVLNYELIITWHPTTPTLIILIFHAVFKFHRPSEDLEGIILMTALAFLKASNGTAIVTVNSRPSLSQFPPD